MAVIGGEDIGPIFFTALGLVAVFSGIFIWLNRDLATEALAAAVAWLLAACLVLGLLSSSPFGASTGFSPSLS